MADQNGAIYAEINLLHLITRAALCSARIILTPEMAASGYSFTSRVDIAASTEEVNSLFFTTHLNIKKNLLSPFNLVKAQPQRYYFLTGHNNVLRLQINIINSTTK